MSDDIDALAKAYVDHLGRHAHSDYLTDVRRLSEAELAGLMRACIDRAGKIRVLSTRPLSGSSAEMKVEHRPGHQWLAWRTTNVVWRSSGGKGKNYDATIGIAKEMLNDAGISPKVLAPLVDGVTRPLWNEMHAAIAGVLDAAFRAVDKDDLEAKKRANIEAAKQRRIASFRGLLKDSIKGLLREGAACEEIQQAMNEVLVESVQEM